MASDVRRRRVAERIKEEVATILLSELKDPRIGMVSVVKVKLSADLRDAAVFVSIMGEEAAKKNSMHGLMHARGFIQTLVAKRLETRFAPIIRFRLDESIEKSIKVSKIIDDLAAERNARQGLDVEAEGMEIEDGEDPDSDEPEPDGDAPEEDGDSGHD